MILPKAFAKLGAFCAALTVSTISCADDPDALKLSATSGKAPLTVRIVGPGKVADLGRGTSSKWVGCGFNVDWHDDSPQPPNPNRDCARYLEHVFAKAGDYPVKVELIQPNPDDSHKVTWTGAAKVSVR